MPTLLSLISAGADLRKLNVIIHQKLDLAPVDTFHYINCIHHSDPSQSGSGQQSRSLQLISLVNTTRSCEEAVSNYSGDKWQRHLTPLLLETIISSHICASLAFRSFSQNLPAFFHLL